MRGVFVAGTDTGVGKTVLAACICAALAARGKNVAAFKPAVTGLDEDAPEGWARDHELLASAASAGQPPWEGGALAESNRQTVERIGNVAVTCLAPITRDQLADAGAQLPVDDWLQ